MKSRKIKVASILDIMPNEWLKHEVELIPIGMYNWKAILSTKHPDLLLVQSTWHDHNNQWRGVIPDFKTRKNNILVSLINNCKVLNIPTVFWNIEDPYHFDEFIEVSKLFDYIFTTDSNSIPKYKRILGHNRIYALPFAAQPRIHNPIDKNKDKLGKVAFAGSWFNHGHEDRKTDMEIILKPALKYNVHIYDRMYSLTKDDDFKFPEIYQPYIKGYLPYEKMNDAYKRYDVFLNVNTVQNSPTMFSCRIFELLACGTNIISGYAEGIEKMFPSIVKLCRTQSDTENNLNYILQNKEHKERLSLLGQREVFKHHTYKQRIETILDKTGIRSTVDSKPGVSIITVYSKDFDINNIFENYSTQTYEKKELIIIINEDNPNLKSLQAKAKEYNATKIYKFNRNKSLTHCLSYVIENANYDYLANFTATDYYSPEFINDLITTFQYNNTNITGKLSHYVYFENEKILAIRFPEKEYQFSNFLKTSTTIIKKKVFNLISPMNIFLDIDKNFFNKCSANNINLYSSDKYNYIQIVNSLNGVPKKQFLQEFKVINNFEFNTIKDARNFVTV